MKLPAWLTPFRNKPDEERLSIDDWAQMFTFGGNSYPLVGSYAINRGSKQESIGNDFAGYCSGAYKASGIVFAVMIARQLIFSEARFQYQQLRDGRPGDLFGTPELAVLENPWPNGTTGELLTRALQDADLGGNNYVVREGVGKGSRLRRLRPDWVTILLTKPPDEAVDSDVAGYLYKPGNTENADLWKVYPIDGSNGTVAHWCPIPDPEAMYRGMSWLTPIIREILADKGATDHKAKFFENAATPNLAVSFKETVSDEQFEKFMRIMNESKHGVEHAYETLYLGGGADVTVVGANLQQMDFKSTQGHGEERIAAAGRVHPVILGISGSFSREPLSGESLTAAKDLFGDGFLRPMWRSLCTAYAPLVATFTNARLWYDDRDIAFLRQDRNDLATIRQIEVSTLSSLIASGFTPDSSIEAIKHNDLTMLEHTGLFSVQLQPPGMEPGDANDPDPNEKPKKPEGPNEGEG